VESRNSFDELVQTQLINN